MAQETLTPHVPGRQTRALELAFRSLNQVYRYFNQSSTGQEELERIIRLGLASGTWSEQDLLQVTDQLLPRRVLLSANGVDEAVVRPHRRLGPLTYYPDSRDVETPSLGLIRLPPMLDKFFGLLAFHFRGIVTKEAFFEIAKWDIGQEWDSSLRGDIRRLRKRIGDEPLGLMHLGQFRYIQTISGRGYKLDPE